ncbi:phosphatase domain-containing protein, partial [Hymenobacter coccineus]|uniref:phosphatase domain-containing protein n=1 Tax=Hymenobacter coccineus TaxID=1908235 RepID=UPI000ACDE5C7
SFRPASPGPSLWAAGGRAPGPAAGRPAAAARPVQAVAEVLVPPAGAEFGVISDLDDTVFESGATNFLRMGFTVLLRNEFSHQPFADVGEFYRALQLGRTGRPDNPFFYISSSPWNLYDALDEFLTLHRIPKGALLLRDVGLRPRNPAPPTAEGLAAAAHFGHKLHEIENVLHAYPHLPFVLLGDSGQEDARIYREVVRRYPGRIRAVYIRDVQVPKRALGIPQLVVELRAENVEMLLVPDYATAMRHAAERGLIDGDKMAVGGNE